MSLVAGLFAGLLALIVARAADLAVMRGPAFARLAALQHRQQVALVPDRGPIVDRHGEPLALSLTVPSVYVRPREFAGQEGRLAALAGALRLPPRTLQARLAGGQPFVWLRRQARPDVALAVERLGLRGVDTVAEGRRFYPHHGLAAHVLGFVGVDSQGLGGLERRFDGMLRGEPRKIEVDRDARGRQMLVAGAQPQPAQGARLELTLDAGIQEAIERELAAGVAAARAVGGAAIVLDPNTGEVLALAGMPTFDPNTPRPAGEKRWGDRVRNRAITDPYEPGSTFKAVLAAAALEEQVVSPSEMVFCENGRFQVGKWTIHDAHPHGWLSFAEVIQYSSNIGAGKIGERLGRGRYYRYLQGFGFGARTGIDLPGETPGILRPADRWARIDLTTHSFGQGVAVTPLQMAVAFAAIANGGELLRPFLVRRIVAADGQVLFENAPVVVRRVISPRTARQVAALLRRVVEEPGGTGARARLDGFSVAGKTGTAQKVSEQGGGYSSKRIGSFIGFAPVENARIVVGVLIDEPAASSYGGVVAAPVFRAIADTVLKRLGEVPARPAETVVARKAAEPPVVAAPRRPEPPGEGTPSFLGLSLREALTRARATGWDVRVSGSGYVRTQTPPPGSPLATERRLALTLVPAAATAQP
jgi:cell division protein FtsI (penicillin-binding protein 3)